MGRSIENSCEHLRLVLATILIVVAAFVYIVSMLKYHITVIVAIMYSMIQEKCAQTVITI